MKRKRSYNVQIWVGLKEHYTDKLFTLSDVDKICQAYVDGTKDCVTVTPTKFIYVNGSEDGVVIGMIQYPRFPRQRREIRRRALSLARKLMIELNQYRVTVTTPYKSYMLEREDTRPLFDDIFMQ